MATLKTLFTGIDVPKPDEGAKQAQLRQAKQARDKTREEKRELAGRDKVLAARSSGPSTLFAASQAGSKASLGA